MTDLDPDAGCPLDVGPRAAGPSRSRAEQRIVGRPDDAKQHPPFLAILDGAEALAVIAKAKHLADEAGQPTGIGQLEQDGELRRGLAGVPRGGPAATAASTTRPRRVRPVFLDHLAPSLRSPDWTVRVKLADGWIQTWPSSSMPATAGVRLTASGTVPLA